MAIGIGSFQTVAQHTAERIVVKGDDIVAGSKGGLLSRFTGWVTGQTARENRAAYEALQKAVVSQYGEAGSQAFGAVEGRLVLGKRLDSAVVRQVLGTAERLNVLAASRKALLDTLPDLPKGSDALASAVVKLGLLGEGSGRLGEHPVEIWSAKNLIPATRDLSFYQVSAQILALDARRGEFLDTVPPAQRGLVTKRLDQAVDIARTSAALQRDQFKASYAEGLTRHIMGIRDAGIVQRFPGAMSCPAGEERSGLLRDADGRRFDTCRGEDSHVGRIDEYMKHQGLSQAAIEEWGDEQASDSWSDGAQALKYVLLQQRDVDMGQYWMGQGRALAGGATASEVQTHFQGKLDGFCKQAKVSERQLLGSMQAWHAMNMEFLARVDLPGNDRAGKTLMVYRTESDVAMQPALDGGLKEGGKAQIKRGPAESGSMVAPVVVFGAHVTEQSVPHHRIFAGYYFERSPGSGQTTFLEDREKEILFMPHGVESTYRGVAQEAPMPAPAIM